MRIVLYMAAVTSALIIGDAVGFGGQYRQMVGQEFRVINPFKRMMRFPSARTNGRPSSIKVARRPW
jgi:hypothetical protein